MSTDVPPEPRKPAKKLGKGRCTCLWSNGRRTLDPECTVTFHTDQIDEVFRELGVTSDIFDNPNR